MAKASTALLWREGGKRQLAATVLGSTAALVVLVLVALVASTDIGGPSELLVQAQHAHLQHDLRQSLASGLNRLQAHEKADEGRAAARAADPSNVARATRTALALNVAEKAFPSANAIDEDEAKNKAAEAEEAVRSALALKQAEKAFPQQNSEAVHITKLMWPGEQVIPFDNERGIGDSDVLTDAEQEALIESIRKHGGQFAVQQPRDLVSGAFRYAANGIYQELGVDRDDLPQLNVDSMKKEILALNEPEATELIHYILYEPASEKHYPNGIRDKGRVGMRLKDFLNHPTAKAAGLNAAEVAALRVYTTAIFKWINNPLRERNTAPLINVFLEADTDGDGQLTLDEWKEKVGNVIRSDELVNVFKECDKDGNGKLSAKEFMEGMTGKYRNGPHPLPVTVLLIIRALNRLRAVGSDKDGVSKVVLWRGMKNLRAPKDFMLNGGTELAPMSTTSNMEVAVSYSLSSESLIFKIITKNALQRGSDLQWVSAFPGEAELLFKPLTFLQLTGRTQVVGSPEQGMRFTVVEIEPTQAV